MQSILNIYIRGHGTIGEKPIQIPQNVQVRFYCPIGSTLDPVSADSIILCMSNRSPNQNARGFYYPLNTKPENKNAIFSVSENNKNGSVGNYALIQHGGDTPDDRDYKNGAYHCIEYGTANNQSYVKDDFYPLNQDAICRDHKISWMSLDQSLSEEDYCSTDSSPSDESDQENGGFVPGIIMVSNDDNFFLSCAANADFILGKNKTADFFDPRCIPSLQSLVWAISDDQHWLGIQARRYDSTILHWTACRESEHYPCSNTIQKPYVPDATRHLDFLMQSRQRLRRGSL